MRKRSITIKGHRTSIALEPAFWDELEKAARAEEKSLPVLVAEIDRQRLVETPSPGLASALRLYVLNRLQSKLSEHSTKAIEND